MKLSAFKKALGSKEELKFQLPNGSLVPSHYHVTEVGYITKNFIDCGGTVREEKVVNFQLWHADDIDHRLQASKLLDIIALSENKLGIGDFEIEVEYQSDTIGKYGLELSGEVFKLATKQTDCLAKDKCEVPQEKTKFNLEEMMAGGNSCTPGGGCC